VHGVNNGKTRSTVAPWTF